MSLRSSATSITLTVSYSNDGLCVLRAYDRMVEAVFEAGEQVAVHVEHLVVYKLSFPDISGGFSLSFLHDDTFLEGDIQVQFEGFLLEFLDHCYICFFKVSDTKLKYFDVLFDLFQEHCFPEKGVVAPVLTAGEHGLEEGNDASSVVRPVYTLKL